VERSLSYLLDSVILIDHFNGRPEATQFLLENRQSDISVITRAEVLTGFDPINEIPEKAFLSLFKTYQVTEEDVGLAASLRREHCWKLPDALQVAVDFNHPLNLATRNSKDVDPARHTFVITPYTLSA
jgi:predicted nucleic acid-binding protein